MRSWSNGWTLIKHSVKVFLEHPSLMMPMIIVWAVYAPTVLYLKYKFPWHEYSFVQRCGVVFAYIVFLSVVISGACTFLLEMLRQVEMREALDFGKAFARTLSKDMGRVIPVAIVWASLWFLLTLLEALLSKKESKEEDENLTAASAARTLAGYEQFSLSGAFIRAMQKGIRMIVFLILPGIAWNGLGPSKATKKGLAILKAHLGEFASGYALTYVASSIIFLPAAIMINLGTGKHGNPPLIHFSDGQWMGLIIYIGLAWSFSLYLEQMFAACLYLWHLKWETINAKAASQGKPLRSFREIPPPYLLRTFPDLMATMPEPTILEHESVSNNRNRR